MQVSAPLDPTQLATLTALANGIIPPDNIDDGAAAVQAGPRLDERVRQGVNAALYLQGIEAAQALAREQYLRAPAQLSAVELHDLLGTLRERMPGFFKQLRMDVSALYLSDSEIWQRIGFPGPSTASGGYPDFDQSQTEKITRLKEI